jgi:hypothetical protein
MGTETVLNGFARCKNSYFHGVIELVVKSIHAHVTAFVLTLLAPPDLDNSGLAADLNAFRLHKDSSFPYQVRTRKRHLYEV